MGGLGYDHHQSFLDRSNGLNRYCSRNHEDSIMTDVTDTELMEMQKKFSLARRHVVTSILLSLMQNLRSAGFKTSEAKPLDKLGVALLRYICESNSQLLPEHPALLGSKPK